MSVLLEPADIPSILPLAARCFEEFKYPGTFAPDHFAAFWTKALSDGNGWILSAWRNGKLVGIMGFMIGPDQFSAETICLVNWWFVLPEHRNHGSGKELLRHMVHVAQVEQCKRILLGFPRGAEEFFRSVGFEPIETGYQKVL